jgi:hypothetical protein
MARRRTRRRPPREKGGEAKPPAVVAVDLSIPIEIVRTAQRRNVRGPEQIVAVQRELERAMVDDQVWALVQKALNARPSLRPHLQTLFELRHGFSMWWAERQPIGKIWPQEFTQKQSKALTALEQQGIPPAEFVAVLGRELWPIERAWAEWLKRVVSRRSGLSRGTRTAIRACLHEFGALLRPTKNPCTNRAILAVMDWIGERVSRRRAHQAIASVIGLERDHVRLRHDSMKTTPEG